LENLIGNIKFPVWIRRNCCKFQEMLKINYCAFYPDKAYGMIQATALVCEQFWVCVEVLKKYDKYLRHENPMKPILPDAAFWFCDFGSNCNLQLQRFRLLQVGFLF